MRKIINPFVKIEGYKCYACCPDNPVGLKMNFFEDGDYVVARWKPEELLQGYKNVLHGGIQATLVDETACWTAYVKARVMGFTSRIDIKYRRHVPVNKGEITIKAKLVEKRHRIAILSVELLDPENNVCTEATVEFFMVPKEKADKEMFYPDIDSFFEK
jgi:uncharacterized protein (TIGR00369 family)